MVVANHTCTGMVDMSVLLNLYVNGTGGRPFRGVAHSVLMGRFRALTRFFHGVGFVAGTRAALLACLQSGTSIFCFPGGEWDSSRPFWRYRSLCWRRRTGFVEVAAAAGAPVVPAALHGTWLGYLVLGRLRIPSSLTRWIDDNSYLVPITVGMLVTAGLAFAAAGGWLPWWWPGLSAVLAAIPNPTRVTLEFLPALDAEGRDPADVATEAREAIEAALRRGPPEPI
jgi:1-acyl-sn-glycerol-3-phosphate acyltransferase